MKKLLLSFLPVLMALTAFSAKAQDFSATVTWDTPGAIQVFKGSSPAFATPVEIAADATSYTVTEKEEYLFLATADYYIVSATMGGANESLVKDGTNGGQYYKLGAKYNSSKYNGKTIELKTDKYVIEGTFTINVENGAEKITFQLWDEKGSLTKPLSLTNGVNTIQLRNVDKQLYIKPSGYPVPELYTATINGADITRQTNGSYTTNIAANDQVVVAFEDPANIAPPCEVKLVFANNNPDCLNNIRDWTLNKFLDLDEIISSDWTLSVEAGTALQFNLIEDCTFNSITSDPTDAIELVNATTHRYKINANCTITIDATTITYEDRTATLYTNNIDGVEFLREYTDDAEKLTVTEVKEVPAGTVTVGQPVNIATTEYTLGGISGKTRRFFFNILSGYFMKAGSVGNRVKEAGDPSDYYNVLGTVSVTADECPLYLDIEKINYNTKGVLFYQGDDDCQTKVTSATTAGETATYLGQTEYLAPGYTEITFDPSYNATFSARFNVNTSADDVKGFYVYADGVSVAASSDSESVFPGIVMKENSVVKLFYSDTAPTVHTIEFTKSLGAGATLTYDQYITTTNLTGSIKNAGSVEYTFVPDEGTVIFLNDQPLAAPYKFTAISGTYKINLMKKSDIPTIDFTVTPADGATVKQLNKLTLAIASTPEMAAGEQSIEFAENKFELITVSNGETTVHPNSTDMIAMDENNIIVEVGFEEPITEAGAWTVEFAEGLLYTTFADESGEFNRTAESALSNALTMTINVDPNFAYKWSFDPENGSQNDLPTADDEFVFIHMSLPEADALSAEPFDVDGAVGPWASYNGLNLKKMDEDGNGDYEVGYDFNMPGQPVLRLAVNASVFKFPGELTVTAEEGAFTVNGSEASPALEYKANFGEIKEYTASFYPVADTDAEYEADDLRTITLVFNPAQTVAVNSDAFTVMFGGIQLMESAVSIADDGKGVVFTIPEDVDIKGSKVSMDIYQESFILDGNQLSPKVTATWNLKKAPVTFDFEASPNIDYVNKGEGVYVALIFDENQTLGRGDNYNDITVEFNGEKLGAVNYDDPSVMGYEKILGGGDYPTAFMFNVYGGAILDPETTGKLTVTIPAGAIKISGEPTPDVITYTWNIIKAKEYTVVVTPADGETVKEITEITVAFQGAETAEVFNQYFVSLRSTDYKYSESAATIEAVEGAECPTFTIKFAKDATDSGVYNFTMYSGAFTLDGAQESPEVRAAITVDPEMQGISSILGDANGEATVVNLQGIVLMKNATDEDLKTLPAGIYIINGQKVAIK